MPHENVRISHDGKVLVVEDDGPWRKQMNSCHLFSRVAFGWMRNCLAVVLALRSSLILAEVYGLTINVRKSDFGGLAIERQHAIRLNL